MYRECDVFYHNDRIGAVWLEEQGMYYRVHCNCRMHDDKMFNLCYLDGDKETKLGLLVPGENSIVTRMHRKDYKDGRFIVKLKQSNVKEDIYKIHELKEPHVILENLLHLRTRKIDGELALVIQDSEQD